MNCARADPEPMTMNGSPRSSTPRSRPDRPMAPPIGACAPWPSKAASPRAPCNAGSVCSPSNPTASATSSSPTTPSSSRRCAISSASISTRPTTPSAVCRRENPGPGAQPHPTDAADGAGLRRRGHPRLRPSRHHHPVRRPRHRHRTGHRPVQEAPSPPGVSRLPASTPTSPNPSTFTSSPTNATHPEGQSLARKATGYHIHYTPNAVVSSLKPHSKTYLVRITPDEVQRLCSEISGTQH